MFVRMIFSSCVRSCPLNISPEPLNSLFTKLGMVVYYHEAICHAAKLVRYLQCKGHNEGLYNQNMTIFTVSSKLQIQLQPNWFDIQHHKPECQAEKLVHFLQCQCLNEGLYNQNMTISTLSSKLLVRLQPNLV